MRYHHRYFKAFCLLARIWASIGAVLPALRSLPVYPMAQIWEYRRRFDPLIWTNAEAVLSALRFVRLVARNLKNTGVV